MDKDSIVNVIKASDSKPKKRRKEEMEKWARFLYSVYKNNPELVKEVLQE